MAIRFRATLLQSGKTATGVEVPPEVVSGLGTSKRPAVRVTINGHTYRSSIASMGGVFMLGVSAENREKAGVAGGDVLDIEVELDTEVREVVIPADLKAALDLEPQARAFFESISYSNKLRHILAIDGAKTAETRQRRIEKSVAGFRDGKA